MEDIDPEVVGVDLQIHLVRLRQDRHRHRRGVDPSLRLGDRHPLDPVDAAFVFQPAEGALPRDQRDDLLESAHSAGGGAAHHLDFPAGGLRKAGIHSEEVLRKEARLITTCPGPDFKDNVLLVVRIPRQQQDPQPFRERFQGFLQLGQFLPGKLPQLFVAFPEKRLVLIDAASGFFVFPEGFDQWIEIGVLLGILLIDPGFADNGRVAQELFQIPVTGFDILQSRKHRNLFRNPSRSPRREKVRTVRTQRAVTAGSCSSLWKERLSERRRRQPGAIPKWQRQGNPRPTQEPPLGMIHVLKPVRPFSPGRRTSC